MTFSLTIRTADDIAAAALAERMEVARVECRRRIMAVCDETAQINLAAAAAAGLLSAGDLATYQTGLAWVAQMRAAWRPMAEAGEDPADNAHWPAIPPGVADLAARF